MVHRKDAEDAGKDFFPLAVSLLPQSYYLSIIFYIRTKM